MAINKVGSKGIEDGSVATADLTPGTVTSDKLTDGTITNANLSNSSVTVAGTSIALGASGTLNNKFVDWQSVVVSDGSTVTTMVAGKGYFINNTSAAGLVKLPTSASIGDFLVIKDYSASFGTNSLTIQRNGHTIQGVANDSLISTNRASLVLVYVDSTKGWLFTDEHNVADLGQALFTEATGGTITTSGNFKIHTFTGDGCFVVTTLGNSPVSPSGGPSNVDYLVVAGGGGGNPYGGGGGAGGYRTTFPSPGCNAGAFSISATTFPITVGGGGASFTPGVNSVFSTITSNGGGQGGFANNSTAGGSGGGEGMASPPTNTGSAGNTPPVSPPQGNAGGSANVCGSLADRGGGAGGGASAVGANGSSGTGGNGGNGSANSITGSSVTRSGGGGGSTDSRAPSAGTAGTGGSGGGGNGVNGISPTNKVGFPGTVNTGGGGGAGTITSPSGAAYGPGGSGGSGIVIIRYKFQ